VTDDASEGDIVLAASSYSAFILGARATDCIVPSTLVRHVRLKS
jgi:hypothetical protein